jgi:hypothetical protein
LVRSSKPIETPSRRFTIDCSIHSCIALLMRDFVWRRLRVRRCKSNKVYMTCYGRTNRAASVSCTCSCREICSASIVAGARVNRGLTGVAGVTT